MHVLLRSSLISIDESGARKRLGMRSCLIYVILTFKCIIIPRHYRSSSSSPPVMHVEISSPLAEQSSKSRSDLFPTMQQSCSYLHLRRYSFEFSGLTWPGLIMGPTITAFQSGKAMLRPLKMMSAGLDVSNS